MAFIKYLQDGQRYMKKWPRHSVVAAFTETRVIPATRIAITMMPALAVLNLLVQWQFHNQQWTTAAFISSLFLLMLPIQGLYWLGHRSNKPLPPPLLHWYQELQRKLKVAPAQQGKPGSTTYMDLAILLRKVLAELPPDEH